MGDVYVHVPSPLSESAPCPVSENIATISSVKPTTSVSLSIKSASVIIIVLPFSATSPYKPSSSATMEPPVTVIVTVAMSVLPFPSSIVYVIRVSCISSTAR